jgi:hypothetical protein
MGKDRSEAGQRGIRCTALALNVTVICISSFNGISWTEARVTSATRVKPQSTTTRASDPEMGGGLRKGNVIYETKIPYLTKQFLAGTDPALKRYYYCHCPWVREAVKNRDVRLSEAFCNCSAGFHKKTFEVIFKQPLKADVLESIIKGDERCRFAIHLPEGAITKKEG